MLDLTENVILSRTRAQDLHSVRKLNCWGSELKDVSIIRNMPNVEVLSLSLNYINSLADFANCKMLHELYLRNNQIADINEIFYLLELTNLKKLWLSENPCANFDNYRMTVLKALPNLEYLDNISVKPEEVIRAKRIGNDIVDPLSDDAIITSYSPTQLQQPQPPQQPLLQSEQVQQKMIINNLYNNSNGKQQIVPTSSLMIKSNLISDYINSENDDQTQRALEDSLIHSSSAYNLSYHSSTPVNCLSRSHTTTNANLLQVQKLLPKGGKNRNSNILTAVLCLIKELDFASLEVVDTTIHCRLEDMED